MFKIKNFIFFILSILCVCVARAENFLDTHTYDILDEGGYSILLYDIQNSTILSFLGSDSTQPDQAAQIQKIEESNPDLVMEATLQTMLLFGHMDLLQIKQKTIQAFKEQNINIYTGNFDLKRIKTVSSELYKAIDRTMAQLSESGTAYLSSAIIFYYLMQSMPDESLLSEKPSLIMLNSAVSIARSRFDLMKWHDKVTACLKDKDVLLNEAGVKDLDRCTKEFNVALSNETNRVLEQLNPYRSFFERITPIPEKEQMVKEKDGADYLWRKK